MTPGDTTKRCLVTGAGAGIGAAIARAAAEAGYALGVLDISQEQAKAIAAPLPGAVALPADVTDEASVLAALDHFEAALGGPPTLVVNNAGIVRFGPLLENSVADFRTVLDVNLLGPYIVARSAARRMLAADGGHIVSLTSINSLTPGPNTGAYPAAKAAVRQLTRQLAIEAGPRLRANCIAPGFIDAGMSTPIYADPAVRALRSAAVPTERLGTAEDIANAVLFLDSPAGSYINGHELVVDGGVVHSLLKQLPRD